MGPSLLRVGFWKSSMEPGLPDPADLVDLAWDPRDRQVVASYLDTGNEHATWKGWSDCRICGIVNGSSDLTDGTWLWPSGLSHYVRNHSVRLPAPFLKHVFSSERGKYLIAMAAASELMRQVPGLSADGSVDAEGMPFVKVYVPRGAKAHHIPDVVMGVSVRSVEVEFPHEKALDGVYNVPMQSSMDSPDMTPDKIASILLRIAAAVDSSESPSVRYASVKLRLLLATLEENLVLVFHADQTVENDVMATDDGTIQNEVDLELMQAGAQSVDWDSDTLYVVVPPGAKVAVLDSFNSMKEGELGEDVMAFLDTLEFAEGAPEESQVASDFARIAVRIARRRKPRPAPVAKRPRTSRPVVTEDMLAPSTEYSCQVDLNLTADFEGAVSKQKLLKKLRTELVASIKTGVSTTAREFGLQATGIHVKPIRVECAVNDQGSPEDELDAEEPEEEPEEEGPDPFEQAKPSRSKKRR